MWLVSAEKKKEANKGRYLHESEVWSSCIVLRRRTRMRTSLSKPKAYPTRRRQSWMDYFLNLLNTDKLIVYVNLYVLLRQIAVDCYPPGNCFGAVVGIIVGAAIGIAKSLAGTTLGVLTAVCILIGLGIGSDDDDGRSTIGIAVLVGAVAHMVGGSSSVAVVSALMIVIGIAIFVFKEERFTTGIISIGAFVCGLTPAVIVSGLHDEFFSGTSLAASLGVAIGISISTITHATKYSAAVGVGATVAGFIICVTNAHAIITSAITSTVAIALLWIGFHVATAYGDNANAAATGVSIATAGIVALVIVVGDIGVATKTTLSLTTFVYILASRAVVNAITGPEGAVISLVALIGAAGGVFSFAFFSGLESGDLHSIVLVLLPSASIYGKLVVVAFAVATRRTHSIAVFSGMGGFIAGFVLTYLLLNDRHLIILIAHYWIIIIYKALQDSEDVARLFLVAFAGFINHLLPFFRSIPKLFYIILAICLIIALFGFSSNIIERSELDNKWKKIKEQLTSVCSQTGELSNTFIIFCMQNFSNSSLKENCIKCCWLNKNYCFTTQHVLTYM